MDKETFDKYVEDRYQKQMDYYSKASAKNQQKYKRLQWILIILSALTPVFVSMISIKSGLLSTGFQSSLNIVVVLISSTVAILTTGLKTFNYQELWITYRATYERLKPEIHYYNFNIGPYATSGEDKEGIFVSRVEAILGSEHTQWPVAKTLSENQGKSNNSSANPE
jgi:hypothetical protein